MKVPKDCRTCKLYLGNQANLKDDKTTNWCTRYNKSTNRAIKQCRDNPLKGDK